MSNRIPLGIVAIGVSVSLWLTGILDLDEALAGFGDPTVIFIATLFVVGEALDSTGVTAWAGQQLSPAAERARHAARRRVPARRRAHRTDQRQRRRRRAAPRRRRRRDAGRAAAVADAHAAGLLRARRVDARPDRHPVNIIVSNAAEDAGARPFAFFEFALAGVPLLVGTLLVIVLFGRRLLPDRCRPTCRRTSATSPTRCASTTRCATATALVGRSRGHRGRRPAALTAHRPAPVHRHGHAERRPRRAGRAARGRRTRGPRGDPARRATPCCSAGRGRSSRSTPPAATRCSSSTTRRRLRRGRAARARGASGRSSSSSSWSCCSRPASSRRRSPGSSRRARSCCRGC